jgi:CHAT domain-containing protein
VAVVVVPHGPFLLDRLKSPAPARADRGRILVVGDVDYGPLPPAEPMPAPGPPAVAWQRLPEGGREAKLVADLARATGKADADELTGALADPTAVRAKLPGARFAHLATHGFFADGTFLSALGADPDSFRFGPRGAGAGAARNPLALSGLALAGANRVGPGAPPDRGLLTAEGIAGLRLSEMELAVLSACDTGLGTEVSGEGVFGLQRALHLAGCRTVVASLWKVNDAATRRLMETFYQTLWSGGPNVTPAQALRAAQLELYRKALAGEDLDRGPLVVPGKDPAPPLPAPAGGRQNAGTRYWAAFVVSGGP